MESPVGFFGCELPPGQEASRSSPEELLALFRAIKPRPVSTPLLRIGGNIDGSYLVPDDLGGLRACFSPGVNRIKYFEDYLTDRYGIECHMCDYSCDVAEFTTPLKAGKQTFLKKWLDVAPGDDNISLEEWVTGVAPEGDLLLQMDIEGAEYRNLISTPDGVVDRFRLIVLEVHGLSKAKNAVVLRNVIAPFFAKLSRNFTCVHAHPNNCCGDFQIPGTDVRIPNVIELTFIRNDRFNAGRDRPLLPHPLDVSRNLQRKPPLFLSEAWCDYDRPLPSKVKILEDRADFQDVADPGDRPGLSGVSSMFGRALSTLQALAAGHPNASAHKDVSRGCRFVLSSSYGGSGTAGVVEANGNYFFHTGFGSNEYIRMDLGARHSLSRIRVLNRLDGFQERASHLFALLSDDEDPEGAMVFVLASAAGKWAECAIDLPEVSARFVTIMSPIHTALHFADIGVYGESLENGDRQPGF